MNHERKPENHHQNGEHADHEVVHENMDVMFEKLVIRRFETKQKRLDGTIRIHSGIIGKSAGNASISHGHFQTRLKRIAAQPMTSPATRLAQIMCVPNKFIRTNRVTCPIAATTPQPAKIFLGTLLMLPNPMAAIAAKIPSCKRVDKSILKKVQVGGNQSKAKADGKTYRKNRRIERMPYTT